MGNIMFTDVGLLSKTTRRGHMKINSKTSGGGSQGALDFCKTVVSFQSGSLFCN